MVPLDARAAAWLLVCALLGGCSLTQNLDPLQDTASGGASASSTGTQGSSSSTAGGGAQGGGGGADGGGGAGGGCAGPSDCLGGDCVDGRCEPVTLWQGVAGGRATGLALNDEDVFWLSTDGVHRMPKTGGVATRLGDDAGGFRIVVHNEYAYYTLEDGLYRQPITAGTSTRIDAGEGRGVLHSGEFIYYVDQTPANEGVYSVQLGTNGPADPVFALPPATFGEAFGIATHAGDLYFTTTEGAYRYNQLTSALDQVFVGAAGDGVAFSGADLFVLSVGLWRAPIDGSLDVEQIADAQGGQLTTDDSHVYFTSTADGRIGRVDFEGAAQELLFEDTPGVDVIAVDDTAIYYTHFLGNRVMRLAK